MIDPTRSNSDVDYLTKALLDPQERNATLHFIRDFPGDARLMLPVLDRLLREEDGVTDLDDLAAALAAAGQPALPLLVEMTGHASPRVRRGAVMAIRDMGRRQPGIAVAALPALAKLLGDTDSDVRRHNAEALAALGPLAEAAVPELIKRLREPEFQGRSDAAYALAHIGPAAAGAVPALVTVLKDESDSYILHLCLRALAAIGPPAKAAAPAVITVLKRPPDPDPESSDLEQFTAACALGAIGHRTEEAVQALTAALNHRDHQVRLASAGALWALDPGNRQALSATVAELKSEVPDIRGQAAVQLGTFGPSAQGAAPALRALLDDPDEDCREMARDALGKILRPQGRR